MFTKIRIHVYLLATIFAKTRKRVVDSIFFI